MFGNFLISDDYYFKFYISLFFLMVIDSIVMLLDYVFKQMFIMWLAVVRFHQCDIKKNNEKNIAYYWLII